MWVEKRRDPRTELWGFTPSERAVRSHYGKQHREEATRRYREKIQRTTSMVIKAFTGKNARQHQILLIH